MLSAIAPAWNIDNIRPYFHRTRKLLADLSYSHLTICLTNDTLTLDSAVSAFTFAVFLDWRNSICQNQSNTVNRDIFVPLFDADRDTFITRTDIYRLFICHCISADFLFFRDDFDFKVRVCHTPTDVLLIDHHILADHNQFMSCYVKEIISHKPYCNLTLGLKPPDQTWPRCLIACAACATVITIKCQGLSRKICKAAWDFFCWNRVIVDLLHTAIIARSDNLSPKVTSLRDEEATYFLESLLEFQEVEAFRKTKYFIFDEARRDLLNFTAMQILKRDSKVYFNIFVSALPILVKDFLAKPDAPIAVYGILRIKNCDYALLLGCDKTTSCAVQKDIAVYHKNVDKALTLGIYLEKWVSPGFYLISRTLPCHPCFIYYKQLNLQAIMKDYLAVLEEFVLALKNDTPQYLSTCKIPPVVEANYTNTYHPGFYFKNMLKFSESKDVEAASSSKCPPGYHLEN